MLERWLSFSPKSIPTLFGEPNLRDHIYHTMVAFEPYITVPGPSKTSMRSATSLWAKKLIDIANPEARGIPSSAITKAPQAPAPVKTGERIAGKYS